VTPEKLRQIDEAEAALKRLGFDVCRVRHFGDVARVEVPIDAIERIKNIWSVVERDVRSAGFQSVEIDERGFKSGRMNESIPRQS